MGILYLVPTPIGNLDDITIRAIKVLFSADYIICEDTRHTAKMIEALKQKINNKIIVIKDLYAKTKIKYLSYYDEIETKRIPEIIELLSLGKKIALVSDSGTPLISDPGYKLVNECIIRKFKIVALPGPSSVTTALIASGLKTDKFIFLGYLPKARKKRINLLSNIFIKLFTIKKFKPTIIFFETRHRLTDTLLDLKKIIGDKNIVICREMTKIFEEIWRGKISSAIVKFSNPKGEFVLLI